jgi:hypothetical protein
MSDAIINKDLPKMLTYFLFHNRIRIREFNVEMLFSKDYDNHWTLSKINWAILEATKPVGLEELN